MTDRVPVISGCDGNKTSGFFPVEIKHQLDIKRLTCAERQDEFQTESPSTRRSRRRTITHPAI